MGIPQSLLNDSSDSAQKKVQRMKRNYAFDRSRYFMPVGASTNIMMLMSARAWVYLCQQLLSHPLPEPRRLGEAIREELSMAAPRMIRHAKCRGRVPKSNPVGCQSGTRQRARLRDALPRSDAAARSQRRPNGG
jgi:thymidylate synthase ThyX